MNKPRRQCIFCDNPVDSKEHIWSTWMHDLLVEQAAPDTTLSTYDRQAISRTPDGKEEITGPRRKPGRVFNVQVRAVCERCNNGWMNRREGQVRPFLESMIKGSQVTLSAADLEALAQWCAQKFIVMEHSTLGTSLTPKADRVALRDSGTIPPYFRIYVGNHVSRSRSAGRRHSHTVARSTVGPIPPLDGTDRNIQTISLIVWRLFLHLNAARSSEIQIEDSVIIPAVWSRCRIWPNPNVGLSWPRRPLLDNQGLGLLSHVLDDIIETNITRWIPFPN